MYRNIGHPGPLLLSIALLGGFFVGTPAWASFIQDGAFETPGLGPGGGFQAFTVGQMFGTGNPWTVVGSNSGNVAIYQNMVTIGTPPTLLYVFDGSQALDLAGTTDNGAATGVSQSFATSLGTDYELRFYIGGLDHQAASPLTVIVNLNGTLFQTATNTCGCWIPFSYGFTATGPTTTLSFINNSAAGVSYGLDAIVVNYMFPAPEPSTAVLVGVGLATVGFLRAKR